MRRLEQTAETGAATDFLVEAGELEQGLADALCTSRDGWNAPLAELRHLVLDAACAYIADRAGDAAWSDLRAACERLDALRRHDLPSRIRIKPPEGYVHYALDPAGYLAAAEEYRDEAGARRASKAVVIGVRSIGTSLSAAVAALVGSQRTATVRPRGQTGARRILSDDALDRHLGPWISEGADVLIVDEGPGATGETLECVACWARELGAGDERIVLFPSRAWGMPLAPQERKDWFAGARTYAPPTGDPRPDRIARRLGLSTPEDLSAGEWRHVVEGADDLPACIAHERRKHRARNESGTPYLLRYAGLARWGEAAASRARALSEAGWAPEVHGLEDGFLVHRWIEGRPLGRGAGGEPDVVRALGDYLGARADLFRTGRSVDPAPLVEMLLENATEGLDPNPDGLSAAVLALELLPRREAVVPDARMQPHEWLRTPDGLAKVDAVDHGDGLRHPGPTDPAWDVAGATIEFGLDDEAVAVLTRRAAAAGETEPELRRALRAYRPAYAASRLGAATLSMREAPHDEDRRRFEREVDRYRQALGRELERIAGM